MTLPLYEVMKRCACGAEWSGPAFTPEPAVRPAQCPSCADREDAIVQKLVRHIPESPVLIPLNRPRRAGEGE